MNCFKAILAISFACAYMPLKAEIQTKLPENCQEMVTRFMYSDQFKTLARLTPLTLSLNSILLVLFHDIIQSKKTNRSMLASAPITLPLAALCTQCIYYSAHATRDFAEMSLKKTAQLLQDCTLFKSHACCP